MQLSILQYIIHIFIYIYIYLYLLTQLTLSHWVANTKACCFEEYLVLGGMDWSGYPQEVVVNTPQHVRILATRGNS